MSSSCGDVCEAVLAMLGEIGVAVDGTENHDDVLEALGKLMLVSRSEK